MFNNWTPEMVERMRQGMAWWAAHPEVRNLQESERCVNEGADGCEAKAEPNGWCRGCWASIAPSKVPT